MKLRTIFAALAVAVVLAFAAAQDEVYTQAVALALTKVGIHISDYHELDHRDRAHLDSYFNLQLFPVLTPLAVDPAHPFPYISSMSLNLAVVVADPTTREQRVARAKVPCALGSLVWSAAQPYRLPAAVPWSLQVWLRNTVLANLSGS